MPDELTDAQIIDHLADEVAERVNRAAPHGTPEFRRQLAALYTRQVTGQAPPPGRISQQELGACFGLSKTRIHQLETGALAKLWREYTARFPDLL
jgi:hypothetical protein